MDDDITTEIYAAAGGDAPFHELVERFYQGIETDPVIRPMYPADLAAPREHLALFLIQRFGGHTQYIQQRGHPRLRMRHVPFRIGAAERDAWLAHMLAAVDAVPAFAGYRDAMRKYFMDSAEFLVNDSGHG